MKSLLDPSRALMLPVLLVLLALAGVLAGCGQKGPLYLPRPPQPAPPITPAKPPEAAPTAPTAPTAPADKTAPASK